MESTFSCVCSDYSWWEKCVRTFRTEKDRGAASCGSRVPAYLTSLSGKCRKWCCPSALHSAKRSPAECCRSSRTNSNRICRSFQQSFCRQTTSRNLSALVQSRRRLKRQVTAVNGFENELHPLSKIRDTNFSK